MSTFGKANKQRNNVYFEETEDFAAVTAQVLGGTKEVNAKYARHIADSCNEITTLREQVEKLTKERDEYKSGFEAAASKYRNLKLQMQEVINVC